MTKEDLIQLVQSQEQIDQQVRASWVARIEQEGVTQEVVDAIRNAVQNDIVEIFKDLNVEVDENDPEYQTAYTEMVDEIDKAQQEMEQTLTVLEEEAKHIEEGAEDAIDQIEEDEARRAILEATA